VDHPTVALAVAAGVLLAAAGYALACWVWPFGTCGACHGTAERVTWLLSRTVPCGRCAGTGQRLRVGRRAYTFLRRAHDRAAAADRRAR
jgi:hypothetical protein